tara:strand:- start:1460 stop:2422 length:963 start_codon:yes stop_codon:yes gene_type:complete
MGYLNYLPKFKYSLAKLTGNVSDIFRRVAFTQKSRNNPQNYSTFTTEGILSPDRISDSELRSSEYYWQVLMMNNIVGESEFPDTYREYSKNITELQNGTSLYFYEFFGSEPKTGHVVFAATLGNTLDFNSGGIIDSYDSVTRKINMRYIFGEGFEGAATAGVYSGYGSGQATEIGKQKIIKQDILADSVSYFYDQNDRETSPYLIPEGLTGGTFANPLGITPANGTLLSEYMQGNPLVTGFYYRSEIQDYRSTQLDKRTIKLPPQELADNIDRDTERLLREGNQKDSSDISGLSRIGASTTSTTSSTSSSSGGGGGGSSY